MVNEKSIRSFIKNHTWGDARADKAMSLLYPFIVHAKEGVYQLGNPDGIEKAIWNVYGARNVRRVSLSGPTQHPEWMTPRVWARALREGIRATHEGSFISKAVDRPKICTAQRDGNQNCGDRLYDCLWDNLGEDLEISFKRTLSPDLWDNVFLTLFYGIAYLVGGEDCEIGSNMERVEPLITLLPHMIPIGKEEHGFVVLVA